MRGQEDQVSVIVVKGVHELEVDVSQNFGAIRWMSGCCCEAQDVVRFLSLSRQVATASKASAQRVLA